MSNRHQSDWVDSVYSNFLNLDVGVPQGSNLSPLFFLVYYDDLPFNLHCSLEAYADDGPLPATGKSVDEINLSLTRNCKKISEWMAANKLKLNSDKSQFLLLGTLTENSEKFVSLLGAFIQSNLKWSRTLTGLCTKLKIRLASLQKGKNVVTVCKIRMIAD